jgi:hypothetical protein
MCDMIGRIVTGPGRYVTSTAAASPALGSVWSWDHRFRVICCSKAEKVASEKGNNEYLVEIYGSRTDEYDD